MDLTHQGLTRFEEGDHAGALVLLTRGARFSRSAAVNYLSAAHAADALGNSDQRETFLEQAEAAGCSVQAVRVASGRMAARRGEPEAIVAALATVKFNPEVVKLLIDAHRALGQWDALEALLPEVKRHVTERLLEVQSAALFGRLRSPAGTPETLRAAWIAAPKSMRAEIDPIVAYASALSLAGAPDVAEKVLRKTLEAERIPALLGVYAGLEKADAKLRLKAVQGWLTKEPESPALLRAAGQIAVAGGNNDAGADYLQRSLRIEPDARAEQALGELCAFNGDFVASSEHFRRALALC